MKKCDSKGKTKKMVGGGRAIKYAEGGPMPKTSGVMAPSKKKDGGSQKTRGTGCAIKGTKHSSKMG